MTDLRIAIQHPSFGPLGWTPFLLPYAAAVAYQSLPWGESAKAKVVTSRPIVGDDFRDHAQCCALGTLGYSHLDLDVHVAKRAKQRTIADLLEEAYELAGLDRVRAYGNIAAGMEATNTSGIWATSTGEYAVRCARLDDEVLAKSPAIRQTIGEIEAGGCHG